MFKVKLSPYHKIFYNIWKLDPLSTAYNIVFDQTLSKRLDISRLKTALQRFISDYFILNSHIKEIDNEVYWAPNKEIRLLEYFSQCNSTIIHEYVSRPFNLETDPLYKFAIFNEANSKYRFIIILHHIIIDGSSFDELISEISKYYNEEYYKKSSNINKQIQTIMLTTNNIYSKLEASRNQNKKFWHNKLLDISKIDLSFIKPNTLSRQKNLNSYKEIYFTFKKNIVVKLAQLKTQYGISPYQFSSIVFAIVLNRYTQQDHFAISYPIAIKEYSGLLYGAGVNTVIQPYTINMDTTVLDLILQSKSFIAEVKNEKYRHAYYPINQVIETSHKELLDILFAQTNLKNTKFDFNNVKTLLINYEFNTNLVTKLLFEQEITEQSLNYKVSYDNLKVDTIILEQFIQHFKKIFFDILLDLKHNLCNKQVTKYDILDATEYTKIIYEWNKTSILFQHPRTINQVFETQVSRFPNNIALVYEDLMLTYSELNIKANQLAHYIKKHYKIEKDDLIVLCLNRSELMIIAILAVLKAGGAYVPVDQSYSTERIAFILSDTNTSLVITNKIYKPQIKSAVSKSKTNANILLVDSSEIFKLILGGENKNNLTLNTNACNLAYVIYTSGTTGKPKGVMVENKSVVNFAVHNDYITIDSKNTVLAYSNYVFDGSIFDIFASLLNGAKLILISPNTILDKNKLETVINTHSVDTLFITTALFISYSKYGKDNPLRLVKRILFGGEAISKSDVHRFFSSCENSKLIHVYGPTESVVFSTYYIVLSIENNIIPIGKALADKTIYVLDKHLKPLPVGAVGELYVGGVSIARGYLNLPELTNKKFVDNYFQTEIEKLQQSNAKLYKTGDLVRWLPDGNLEYIARNDLQIKISGFRIEPGEIENELSKYSESDGLQHILPIKQSIVLAMEHKDTNGNLTGDKYLVGYYVARFKLDEEKILTKLRSELPEYMVPSILIHIDKIPLTIGGKLDRQALPVPIFTNVSKYIAPRTEFEMALSNIFAEILNLESGKISITDSFFRLGGNSVKVVNLVSKINQHYNSNIKVVDVFMHPNIMQLIAKISQTKVQYQAIVNFNQMSIYDNRPILFMVHPGYSGCEVYSELSNNLKDRFSCYGIESYNLYSKDKIRDLHELAVYYLSEIEKVMHESKQNDYYLLGWSLGGKIILEIAAILESKNLNLKIELHLLDTIIVDNTIIKYQSAKQLKMDMQSVLQDLRSRNYEESYINKMGEVIEIAQKLHLQNISRQLLTTKIILYKALQLNPIIEPTLNKYMLKLKYNNVDMIHQNLTNITVFKFKFAHHDNILDYVFIDK